MACVLTLAVLENGAAVVGHVGDSRLYLIGRGEIRKITHDHSPVGEREDAGEIDEAEAMRHPRRNEVYRDVGSEEHTPDDPDFIEIQHIGFEPSSALVLCSDGLSDLVPSEKIREMVERHAGDPEAATRALIEAANQAGGKDNVTVVLVEGEQFRTIVQPTAISPEKTWRGWVVPAMLGLVAVGLMAAAGAVWWRGRPQPQPAPVEERQHVWVVESGRDTIMDAVLQAKAGDRIEVRAGEYREPVVLKSE